MGRFIASFGQQMLTVAVGWELYDRTHSAMALGLVGLTQFLPQVLMTLPSGHVADTRNRKQVIIIMQGLCLNPFIVGIAVYFKDPRGCKPGLPVLGGSVVTARTFLWSRPARRFSLN